MDAWQFRLVDLLCRMKKKPFSHSQNQIHFLVIPHIVCLLDWLNFFFLDIRPPIFGCPAAIADLIERCWDGNSIVNNRPEFREIVSILSSILEGDELENEPFVSRGSTEIPSSGLFTSGKLSGSVQGNRILDSVARMSMECTLIFSLFSICIPMLHFSSSLFPLTFPNACFSPFRCCVPQSFLFDCLSLCVYDSGTHPHSLVILIFCVMIMFLFSGVFRNTQYPS